MSVRRGFNGPLQTHDLKGSENNNTPRHTPWGPCTTVKGFCNHELRLARKSGCSVVLRASLFKRSFQRSLKRAFHASAVLQVSCSFLSLSLSPNIFALFSPAIACTRSHLAELRRQRSLFPRFFSNEALNTLLHLSHRSEELSDVTIECSRIIKQALTWVATTPSGAIK